MYQPDSTLLITAIVILIHFIAGVVFLVVRITRGDKKTRELRKEKERK